MSVARLFGFARITGERWMDDAGVPIPRAKALMASSKAATGCGKALIGVGTTPMRCGKTRMASGMASNVFATAPIGLDEAPMSFGEAPIGLGGTFRPRLGRCSVPSKGPFGPSSVLNRPE